MPQSCLFNQYQKLDVQHNNDHNNNNDNIKCYIKY